MILSYRRPRAWIGEANELFLVESKWDEIKRIIIRIHFYQNSIELVFYLVGCFHGHLSPNECNSVANDTILWFSVLQLRSSNFFYHSINPFIWRWFFKTQKITIRSRSVVISLSLVSLFVLFGTTANLIVSKTSFIMRCRWIEMNATRDSSCIEEISKQKESRKKSCQKTDSSNRIERNRLNWNSLLFLFENIHVHSSTTVSNNKMPPKHV